VAAPQVEDTSGEEEGVGVEDDSVDDEDDITQGFELVPASELALAQQLSQWGIEVFVPIEPEWSVPGGTHGQRPGAESLKGTLGVFVQALSAYPASFASGIRLQRLLVVDQLHHKRVRVGMIAITAQHTIAGAANLVGSVHHEIFHLVDYQLLGRPPREADWLRLNPDTFRYQGLGRDIVGRHKGAMSELTGLRSDLSGFISQYSMASGEEDRAELFRALMTDYAFVVRRCSSDPVLDAKVAQLKGLLSRLSPEMGDDFWEHHAAGSR
jgi:hypothetical protein